MVDMSAVGDAVLRTGPFVKIRENYWKLGGRRRAMFMRTWGDEKTVWPLSCTATARTSLRVGVSRTAIPTPRAPHQSLTLGTLDLGIVVV